MSVTFAIHIMIISYSISIATQWINGHNDLLGNEMANRLAKARAAVQEGEDLVA